jgi:protein-S-isoprenylcysteine O-methyltransferase Ste14
VFKNQITMITAIILTCFFAIVSLMATVFGEARAKKKNIFGRPPIHVVLFVLAKLLVLVNLTFLLLKGFSVKVFEVFTPGLWVQVVALVFLVTGTVLMFLTTIQLRKDLIFGLSSSADHTLQTGGIYSFSRHPFYLGFIFVLLASCLLTPHLLNIAAFLGTWILHHFIMIREEQFLTSQYGEKYSQYAQKVNRYFTLIR